MMSHYEWIDGKCYYVGEKFVWPSYDAVLEENGIRVGTINLNWMCKDHAKLEELYQAHKGKLYNGRRIVKTNDIKEWFEKAF